MMMRLEIRLLTVFYIVIPQRRRVLPFRRRAQRQEVGVDGSLHVPTRAFKQRHTRGSRESGELFQFLHAPIIVIGDAALLLLLPSSSSCIFRWWGALFFPTRERWRDRDAFKRPSAGA